MPSGTILHSTHEANLDLPGLPAAAQHGHIMPQLATQLLISIGQLCDAGCDVAFTATIVTISHNNNIVLQGQCTPATKLWELDVQQPSPTFHANAALGSTTFADLMAFVHDALFSLALSTLEEALLLDSLWQHSTNTLPSLRPLSKATWIKPTKTSIPPSVPHQPWSLLLLIPCLLMTMPFHPQLTMVKGHISVMQP